MFSRLDLILPLEAWDGPMQMALDEVLLGEILRPTLRIYAWSSPWVTFGYFQQIGAVRESYPGLPVVRRWTGGGMVEHGEDLTFSLMIPSGERMAAESPSALYQGVHGNLACWIRAQVPMPVQLAGSDDLRTGASCFQAPVHDDLMLHGKKVLGGALRRSRGGVLYQGSLRIHDIPGWNPGIFSPDALATSLGKDMAIMELSANQVSKARNVCSLRYASREWNERK
jgi:lipoyl(octanoyl) transferase